jgi:hypothetical protein
MLKIFPKKYSKIADLSTVYCSDDFPLVPSAMGFLPDPPGV